MASKTDIIPKAMDVTARSIDLLALLARVAHETEFGTFAMKEIGRWLGKEGLDENELHFFLESTKAMARPNDQTEISTFFDAVNYRKPKKTVVPLWAQPSGALGIRTCIERPPCCRGGLLQPYLAYFGITTSASSNSFYVVSSCSARARAALHCPNISLHGTRITCVSARSSTKSFTVIGST